MTFWVIFGLVAVLIVGGCLLFIVTRGVGRATLNVEKYRSDYLTIEQSVQQGNESSYHLAILNADKLLDRALRERGFRGQTMGERMKAAQTTWHNANHVWSAHKLRNQLAHETNFAVNYDTTRRALEAFKQGLKDVGAV